jgi:hypothetical protein
MITENEADVIYNFHLVTARDLCDNSGKEGHMGTISKAELMFAG